MNQYQESYFNLMTQTREHVFYVYAHIKFADKWDGRINIFMALTSSSSIGAWVLWQKLAWLWAFFIATSQVVTVIKPYLPFKKRLTYLKKLNDELERLSLDVEKDWYTISNGELTEREIHAKISDFKSKKVHIEQEFLRDIVLPERKDAVKEAREKNEIYFSNNCIGVSK